MSEFDKARRLLTQWASQNPPPKSGISPSQRPPSSLSQPNLSQSGLMYPSNSLLGHKMAGLFDPSKPIEINNAGPARTIRYSINSNTGPIPVNVPAGVTISNGTLTTTGGSYTISYGTASPSSTVFFDASAAPAGYPALPVEDRAMPVIGYRAWHVRRQQSIGREPELVLGSVGILKHFWHPGVNHATCWAHGSPDPKAHPIPNDTYCQCGFWVLSDLDDLDQTYFPSRDSSTVYGAVIGWGRVIQHGTKGWRAQHSQILGLLLPRFTTKQDRLTKEAARAYGVEAYDRSALELVVKEYGDPL